MNTVRYMYFGDKSRTTPKHKGFITVASKRDENDTTIGVAFCLKRDKFTKKEGREVACSRLNEQQIIIPNEMIENHGIRDVFATYVKKLSDIPSWAKKALAYRPPTVLITLSGGVCSVVSKPKGTKVEICDYDIEGCDENDLSKDYDGDECVKIVYR